MKMPTQQQDKQQDKQRTNREKEERQQLDAIISEQVMHILGQPGDLQRVQVRRLWEDHYRVNVLVGVDAASVRVLHSYFLLADHEGKIIASTPKINRQY